MHDSGDIRMMNLRRSARLAQKSRTRNRIFRELPTDDFECND
jgi:hypothetical protein